MRHPTNTELCPVLLGVVTKPVRDLLRRHSAILRSDRRHWQEWEQALQRFVVSSQELERARTVWELRVVKAMRGVNPQTWWYYHSRTDAGELWVAASAKARRAQRVVQVTGPAVVDLVRRRDHDLRSLASARSSAETELRACTMALVATLGVDRVAFVLGLSPAVVRSLCRGDQRTSSLEDLFPAF